MIAARKTMSYEISCVTAPATCDLDNARTWDEAKRIADEHRAKTGHGVHIDPPG